MARCTTFTGLPIDTWAEILGISPWEFNGFTFPASKSAQCRSVFRQFQWQQQHISREEVGQAIADAEEMIARECLFYPYPKYFVDAVVQYPRPARRDLWGAGGTIRGEWKTIQMPWHQVVSGGVFNRTSIGTITLAGAGITLQDNDGDGIFETFTAIITNAAIGLITDANELGLYFVAADRHGEDIGEAWRVRPVKVTISGNTATFRGHRTLLANPSKAYAVQPSDMDATDSTNYITSLDCYRAFTDTTATDTLPYQGVAIWKDDPDCTEGCTFSVLPLCLGEHQNSQGRVFASWGTSYCWPSWREPDRLEVNFLAGLPLLNGQMQPEMAKMVTYLSTALLAHETCGCEESNRILAYWRSRVIKFEDNSANATSYAHSDNPFPATNGGVWAYKRVKKLRNIEVVSI